jgi:hypothetical protein
MADLDVGLLRNRAPGDSPFGEHASGCDWQ